MINRKYFPRYGWYLYDFGNSILIINGGLYFPQWIVKTNGVNDFIYNLAFILSSVFLIVAAPFLGSLADRSGAPLRFLFASNAALIFAGVGVGLAPAISSDGTRIVLALSSFLAVLVSYQLSLVFYNAQLGRMAPRDLYERISGRALAWGWCGGVAGIFIGLLFARGAAAEGGMAAILPCAIIAGVISNVSLFLMSYPSSNWDDVGVRPRLDRSSGFRAEVGTLRRNAGIWVFLVAFFLFSDAILTLQNNSTIYMQVVLRLSDEEKALEFLLILVTSAVGAILSSPLVRVFGLKQSLAVILASCAFVVAIMPFFMSPIQFSIIFGVMGLLNGGIWNISRVLFFRLIPTFRRNMYFGFYSTFERFASIVGPAVWSVPILLVNDEVLRYQVAWSIMATFFAISVLLLSRLQISEGRPEV